MFGREFGWSPAVVRDLTVQQTCGYLAEFARYREKVPGTDVTIKAIRLALFAWFGIKEESGEEREEQMKASPLPVVTITREEKDAWVKAGTPAISSFLKEYRDGH